MQSSFQVDLSGSIGVGLNKELKVVQVASGSSAEAAGMPLGSRIIAIDGVQVHEYADAAREMQAARSLGNAMCTVAFAFPKDSEESDSGHDISGQANNERERSDTKNANSPHIPSTNRVAHRHGVSHKKQPTQQTFRLSTATLADLAAATAEALRPAPEATAGWFAKDVEATYKAALGQDGTERLARATVPVSRLASALFGAATDAAGAAADVASGPYPESASTLAPIAATPAQRLPSSSLHATTTKASTTAAAALARPRWTDRNDDDDDAKDSSSSAYEEKAPHGAVWPAKGLAVSAYELEVDDSDDDGTGASGGGVGEATGQGSCGEAPSSAYVPGRRERKKERRERRRSRSATRSNSKGAGVQSRTAGAAPKVHSRKLSQGGNRSSGGGSGPTGSRKEQGSLEKATAALVAPQAVAETGRSLWQAALVSVGAANPPGSEDGKKITMTSSSSSSEAPVAAGMASVDPATGRVDALPARQGPRAKDRPVWGGTERGTTFAHTHTPLLRVPPAPVAVPVTLLKPLGMGLAPSSLRVTHLLPGATSPASKGGVKCGWRLVRVGRDPVTTLPEFVAAMARRRGQGDSEATLYFDAGGRGWRAGAASAAATAAAAVAAFPGPGASGQNRVSEGSHVANTENASGRKPREPSHEPMERGRSTRLEGPVRRGRSLGSLGRGSVAGRHVSGYDNIEAAEYESRQAFPGPAYAPSEWESIHASSSGSAVDSLNGGTLNSALIGEITGSLQRERSQSLTRRAGAPRDLPEAGVEV